MRGKHYGSSFERLLTHCARMQGYLLVEHGVKVRFASGRAIPLKSDLDYRLMHNGRCVFFDAKSRAGQTLPLSGLAPSQRALVRLYSSQGFSSGYVVEFRELRHVYWFDAAALEKAGERGSLKPDHGVSLGTTSLISMHKLFATSSP